MPTKHPVSAVMITHNCGENLEKILQCLSWCDEIIVVDSGSTDNTLKIVQQFGCKVFEHEFTGYGTQKRFAISLAKNDWILSLDGDEVITNPLREEIEEIFNHDMIPANGFYIPITLVFMGKVFNYGKENKYPHLRLFNRSFGNFNEATVHETIECEGSTAILKNHILHYSYKNIQHYFEKFNKFTSSFVNDALRKHRKTNKTIIIFRLPMDFVKAYFLRMNFLNGFPGFVWSVLCAYYSFVKLVKLYETEKKL